MRAQPATSRWTLTLALLGAATLGGCAQHPSVRSTPAAFDQGEAQLASGDLTGAYDSYVLAESTATSYEQIAIALLRQGLVLVSQERYAKARDRYRRITRDYASTAAAAEAKTWGAMLERYERARATVASAKPDVPTRVSDAELDKLRRENVDLTRRIVELQRRVNQ